MAINTKSILRILVRIFTLISLFLFLLAVIYVFYAKGQGF